MLQREGIPTQPRFTENRIAVSCLQFNQSSESGESGSSPGDFAPGGSSSLSPCSFMACLLWMTARLYITCSCCNLLTCLTFFHPFLSTVTNTQFSYKYRLYIYKLSIWGVGFETGHHYVAMAGLEPTILLPESLIYQDYKYKAHA